MSAIKTPAPRPGPFLTLNTHDIELLTQSEGFDFLREHLAETYHYDFCNEHRTCCTKSLDQWLIVRDILHALLVPIVEIFDKAAVLVNLSTDKDTTEADDVLTGSALGVLHWLQHFLSNPAEREWCYTEGCPACVVNHVSDSLSAIRLLWAACFLSDVHYPFTLDGPTLPSFAFLLDTLEQVFCENSRFVNEDLELSRSTAVELRDGIEDLIHQCLELEIVHCSPPPAFDLQLKTKPVALKNDAVVTVKELTTAV